MRAPETLSPGIYGYLILLAGIICVFIFLTPEFQTACFFSLLLYSVLFQRDALSRMARWPMLIFALTLLAVSSTDVHTGAGGHLDISFSGYGMLIGLRMLMRACGIFVAAQIFSVRVPVLDMTRLADAIGMRGFGFSLGVAFHMLPEVHVIARETRDALRLRGIYGTHRLKAAKRWLLAILVQLVQRSDEIVASARTRGFGSGKRYRYFPGWRSGDSMMLLVVIGTFILGR